MKPVLLFLLLTLPIGPLSLFAEEVGKDSNSRSGEPPSSNGSAVINAQTGRPEANPHPFALGGTMESVSSLGVQFQLATNLNRHTNLRTGLNIFEWKKGITFGGYTSDAHMNMASISTSLDFYPFPKHGFRLSPGLLIHNPQPASAQITFAPNGGPFTLNGHTYYSSTSQPNSADPRTETGPEPAWASEGLKLQHAAFTMTTGWGNMIPRKTASHWSFPVEVGVAFLGSPSVNTTFIAGRICDAQGQNCFDAASNQQLQSDIQAQFSPYKSHLDMLKTYPVISFGVAYIGGRLHALRD